MRRLALGIAKQIVSASVFGWRATTLVQLCSSCLPNLDSSFSSQCTCRGPLSKSRNCKCGTSYYLITLTPTARTLRGTRNLPRLNTINTNNNLPCPENNSHPLYPEITTPRLPETDESVPSRSSWFLSDLVKKLKCATRESQWFQYLILADPGSSPAGCVCGWSGSLVRRLRPATTRRLCMGTC